MSRRSLSLGLVLVLALVSILLNVVTNDLTSGSPDSVPALRALRQWSLPTLAVLVALLLIGQGVLFFLERPARRVWAGPRPPYPGLEPFAEEDAAVFFGREAETAELLDRLSPRLASEAHRFVAVVGPSGSGKSSLVHAGLIPALGRRRRRWVVVPTVVPEDRPLRALARSLVQVLPGVQVEPLAEQLLGEPGALVGWLEELRLARGGRSCSVLLVVDQAEDLLTLTAEEERDAFLGLLRAALGAERWLWVVAALRSEFLSGFLTAGFTDLFHQPVVVGSPSRAALFEMIQRPADQAGLRFAPGLVNEMVDDTGGGDALPMLAYTLQALFLRAGAGGTVTMQDYRQLGGVAGALSDQADRVAAELGDTDALLAALMRFVSVEESGPVRRRVLRSRLSEAERRIVDAFILARLLTSDAEAGDAVIQVAHEALFRQWPPLRQAVDAGAETLRQRAQLERWAQDWARAGRRDSYLLTGERLEAARRWAAGGGGHEHPLVGEFLEHSTRLDRAAMARLSQAVALRSVASQDRDPELAVLLARAAVEECGVTPLAYRALLTGLLNPGLLVLRGHDDSVHGVAWSPDGSRLVSCSEDRTARVWAAADGRREAVLLGHEDGLLAVAWSPDGRWIATGARDRTVRLWDARRAAQLAALGQEARPRVLAWSPDGLAIAAGLDDGTTAVWDVGSRVRRVVLEGHEDWVRGVAWSPDGLCLATGSRDRTVRLWGARRGAELAVLLGHGDGVREVAWSPDGGRLASASRDRTARLWDARRGAELAVLRGHDDAVDCVRWSPDGRRVATGSGDRTARVWDAARGTCLIVLRGHESTVTAVAWSPDGPRLGTVSEDRTVRVWQVDWGVEPLALRGHTTTVQSVAWSGDGRRMATASRDRTARVWDAERGVELVLFARHEGTVRSVAWSPEGRRLATAAEDRTVRVWDAEHGTELLAVRGHDETVRGVAWSPEGRRLATVAHDRTLRVWDAGSGRELLLVRAHRDQVRAVAWSPEGRRLATISRDRTARVWDGGDGLLLAELRGHQATVRGLAWSPEGRRLATASDDGTVRTWDAETGAPLLVLRGHESWVRSVAWSPDGGCLATGSADRTVRLWDLARGAELAVIGVHADMVESVAWSPEGRRVASASRDGTVRVWRTAWSLDWLLERAGRRVSRELTAAERRDALLPEGAEGPAPAEPILLR